MTPDIVIVPTYDRPEYLALCLEKLRAAQGSQHKNIWVVKDAHIGDVEGETFWQTVRLAVKSEARLHREPHNFYGNSFNVLEAFKEAYATGAKRVYLVEDDVMVMPDFFQWHEAAQDQFHPFVSCAGRVNRSLNFETNGREAIDEACIDPLACSASGRAYGSWAACFSHQILGLILQEAERQDFAKHIAPGNEQDIFIQRLMPRIQMYEYGGMGVAEFHDRSSEIVNTVVTRSGFSVWPYVPRAYHMGMSSYHRNAGLKFNGSLEEKIAALRSTISDPYKIRLMALLQDDIDAYPTQPTPDWSGKLFLKSDYR